MRLYNSISWALLREPKLRAYLLSISGARWRWQQSPFSAANANYRSEGQKPGRSWPAHENNVALPPKRSGCLFGCGAQRRLAGCPRSDYDYLWLVCALETDYENRAMVNRATSGVAFRTLCSSAGRSAINAAAASEFAGGSLPSRA